MRDARGRGAGGGGCPGRAATTACTVGGSARPELAAPSWRARSTIPVVSTMKNGLPPVRSAISSASASPTWPPAASRTSSSASATGSGSSRSVTAFTTPDPHAGRSSSSSGRPRAIVSARCGPFRVAVTTRSIRSSIGGRSPCTSSKTRTTGPRPDRPSTKLMNPLWTSCTKTDSSRLGAPNPIVRPRRPATRSASLGSQHPSTTSWSRRFASSGCHLVVDAGDVADDRGDGSERRGVAVGLRAPAEHGDVVAESRDQLVGEPGLAHPRLPEDRDQERARRRLHPRDAAAEDVQLVRAADERDRAASRTRGQRLHRVRGQRVGEPLRLDLLLVAEGDRVLGEGVRRRPHQHLPRVGAAVCSRAAALTTWPVTSSCPVGTDAGRGLAGLDPDPDLERLVEAEGLLEAVHPIADRESCADRPHRVVLTDVGQAEHRHHGVADELLRVAAERAQLLARGVEEPAEDLAGSLGIEPLRESGRVHEVREQDRDDLPLLRPEGRRDGRPAVRTEPGAVGEGLAAEVALHPGQHRWGRRPGSGPDRRPGDGKLGRHGTHNVPAPGGLPRMARATSRHRARAVGRVLQEERRHDEHDVDGVGGRGALLRLDRRHPQEHRRRAVHEPVHATAGRQQLERA